MTKEEALSQYRNPDGSYDTDAILNDYRVDPRYELDAIFNPQSDSENLAAILLDEAHRRNAELRLASKNLPTALGVLVMLFGAIATITPFVLAAAVL